MRTQRLARGSAYAALLAILGSPAWSANAERPVRSVFAGNTALQRPLTLSTRSIRLGELVDRIAALTGVDLEVDDQRVEPVSGYSLTVVVHNRRAAETLEAIASLYSFRPDRWYWERTSREEANPKYVLRHTLPAAAARQTREAIMRATLQDQFRKLSALYSATPQQRNRMAALDPMLAAYNTPRNADFLSFLALLSPAEVDKVMSGGDVEVPRSRLSSRQRAFITKEYRDSNLLGQPNVPQPDTLDKVTVAGAGLNEPSIMLNLGPLGSHGLVGGIWMDAALKAASTRNWTGSDDSNQAPQGSVPAAGVSTKLNDDVIRGVRHDSLLRRLGRIGKLNILFDRTTPSAAERRVSMDFPLEGDLADLLPRLCKDRFVWKRRSSFLLFRPEGWEVMDRGEVPSWPVVRDLRRAVAANGGYLRPEDWIRLGRFGRDALELLEDEFPDAKVSQIGRVHGLMRLAFQVRESDRQQWDREGGVGWNDLSPRARAVLRQLEPKADLRRIRVLLQWKANAQPPSGTFYLGYQEGVKNPIRLTFQKRVEPVEPDD